MTFFFRIIYNISETLLEGKVTNRRYIKYQFKVYSRITIVFIKVKANLETPTRYMDCVA